MGNLFSNIYWQSNNSSNTSIMLSTVKQLPILNISDATSYVSGDRYFTEDDYMKHNVLFKKLYISIVMEYYADYE